MAAHGHGRAGRRLRRRAWQTLVAALLVGPASARHHDLTHVDARTTVLGAYSSSFKPVLEVSSGDTVSMRTVSGVPPGDVHVQSGYALPKVMKKIYDEKCRGWVSQQVSGPTPFQCGAMGPHLLTGPIAVKGAQIGDALAVEVVDIDVWQQWSWNLVKPPKGSLGHDFDGVHSGVPLAEVQTWRNDLERRATHVSPPGVWVSWNVTGTGPFLGCMGTAPPPSYGVVSSVAPRMAFGGNLDLKLLTKGATLVLPVNVPGALFSAGDGHAVQGDGEVCTTAVETGLLATLRFTRIPRATNGAPFSQPRAWTKTHLVAIGLSVHLDEAEKLAMKDLLNWLSELAGWTTSESYRLASVAADVHVTQVVNEVKGVHILFPRRLLPPSRLGPPLGAGARVDVRRSRPPRALAPR